MGRVRRNPLHFQAEPAGELRQFLVGRSAGHEFAARQGRRRKKGGHSQQFARARTDHDLRRRNSLARRDLRDQRVDRRIGIPRGRCRAGDDRLARGWRWAVGVLVAVQQDRACGRRRGSCPRGACRGDQWCQECGCSEQGTATSHAWRCEVRGVACGDAWISAHRRLLPRCGLALHRGEVAPRRCGRCCGKE